MAFRPWLLEAERKRNNVDFDRVDEVEEAHLFA